METIKKCLNPKVLIGLAIVASSVALFAPNLLVAALPLLLLAACPLSMVLMMSMMNKSSHNNEKSVTPKKEGE